MGNVLKSPEVANIVSEVEKADPTPESLQRLRKQCDTLPTQQKQELAEQLRTLQAAVEEEKGKSIDENLTVLQARLGVVDQLLAHLETTPPNPVEPPQGTEVVPISTNKLDITSKGQRWGEVAGAAVGNVAGGGVEGGWNLLRREWEMARDPNMHVSDKALRWGGITVLVAGIVYLLNRIVRGAKDKTTGKRKGGIMRGILTALGITAAATWGLSRLRPWTEKRMAKEAAWRKRAEARMLETAGTPATT